MSSELAIVYASLILHDGDVPITAENLNTVVRAAGVSVEPIWAKLFAKALQTTDLASLLSNVGSAAASAPIAAAAGSAPAAGGSAAPAAAAAPAKEAEKEESDEDMGFGLFD